MSMTRARGNHAEAAATKRLYLKDNWIRQQPPPEKTRSIYDAKVETLGLRMTPAGKRSFFWYRSVAGKLTWRSLGEHPAVSVEVARGMASDLDDKLEAWRKKGFEGANPFAIAEVPDVLTLEAATELYIDQHVALRSKNPDKAAKTLRGILRLYLDDWKSKELGEIRRKDVLARHARLWKTIGGTTANVVVTHLHTVFEWAITRELFVGANPAKLHADDRAPGVERKRYLEPKELARVLGACEKYQQGSVNDKDLACFVLLSLATGQRKQTVMKAKWSSINLRDATWSLEASETKNGEAFTVELSPAALRVLNSRDRKLSPAFVFPGFRRDRSIDPSRARDDFGNDRWERFRKDCGLWWPRSDPRNFRVHDLRHTYVSYQVMAGRSLEQAGRAVGHASSQSTRRYAHLSKAVVRESVLAGEAEMMRRVAEAQKQLTAGD